VRQIGRVRGSAFGAAAILGGSVAILAAQQTPPAQQPPPAQQQQQPPPQPPPRFRSEANYIRVDVYATRDDQPVQDLTGDDFEVTEDGKPQKIDAFEHVVVRPAGPQAVRIEPNNQREGNQMAANPRARVFVIFLDTNFVNIAGGHDIAQPLIELMERALGPEDLVGLMTPDMSVTQLVFARKTEVIQAGLIKEWPWGRRFALHKTDKETTFEACYPPPSPIGRALLDRYREEQTLQSLHDLIVHLQGIREERTAVLTVTEGWIMYQPDRALAESGQNLTTIDVNSGTETLGPDGRVMPRPGGSHRDRVTPVTTRTNCDEERMRLANLDNWNYFRNLMGMANRANVSFYPIDPRGLPAFDAPIGPDPPPPVAVDMAILKHRLDRLRELADNTDGVAILNSNDLKGNLRRLSDDLTSYYLLGYYTSNPKLDGAWHRISVRVKRPGVKVRSRSGYRAATEAEVRAARSAADAPVPDAKAAVTAALGTLARAGADGRLRLHAAAATFGDTTTVWVAGEVPPPPAGQPDPIAHGGSVDIDVSAGGASASAHAEIAAGARAFLAPVKVGAAAPTGSIDVRGRVRGPDAGAGLADIVRLDAPARGGSSGPLLFRRGPSTANLLQPAADLRFQRSDRLHIELPVAAEDRIDSATLLDRNATKLPVPVTTGERTDAATGQRWFTADVALAPLGAGDYILEFATVRGTQRERVLTALRVVR
jgi:VWFA-related protein